MYVGRLLAGVRVMGFGQVIIYKIYIKFTKGTILSKTPEGKLINPSIFKQIIKLI